MPPLKYSMYATSTEYVPFTVSVTGTTNPTTGTVSMAFIQVPPPTQPSSASYVSGSWQGALSPYVAQCLVSGTASTGGAATLSTGVWFAWLRLALGSETPILYSGVIQVS